MLAAQVCLDAFSVVTAMMPSLNSGTTEDRTTKRDMPHWDVQELLYSCIESSPRETQVRCVLAPGSWLHGHGAAVHFTVHYGAP